MNPDSPEFEQLRRLFAIKRHEQPPPGYFDRFSRDVVARIKSGDQGNAAVSGSWLQRLWQMLETKPVFAGAFGASVCAFLISGLVSSEESGVASGAVNPLLSHANATYPPDGTLAANHSSQSVQTVLPTNTDEAASLNSLFDFNPGQLNVQPVNWAVPAGN